MNFSNLLKTVDTFYQESMLSDLFIKTAIGETDVDENQTLSQMASDEILGPELRKFQKFGRSLSQITNRKILNCMLAFYEAKNKIEGSYTKAEDYIATRFNELNEIDADGNEDIENAIEGVQDILITLNENLRSLANENPEEDIDRTKIDDFYRFISRLKSEPTKEGLSSAEKTFEEAKPDRADAFEEVMLGSGEEGDAAKKGSIFIRKEFQDWETSVKEEKEKYEKDLKIFNAAKEPLIVSRLRSLIDLIDKYIIPTAVEARDLENRVRLYGNNPTNPDAIKEIQKLASLKELLKTYIIERRKEKATFRRDLSLYSIRNYQEELKPLQDNKEELDSNPRGNSKIERKKLEIKISINEALSKRDYGRRAANKIRFKLLNYLNKEIENGNLKNNADFDSREEIQKEIKFYEDLIHKNQVGIKTKQQADKELTDIRNSYAKGNYGPVYKYIWLLKRRLADYKSDSITKVYTSQFINKLIENIEKGEGEVANNPVFQRSKESVILLANNFKKLKDIIKDKDYRKDNNKMQKYFIARSDFFSQRKIVYESIREGLQQEYNTISDITKAQIDSLFNGVFNPIRDNLNKFYVESEKTSGVYAKNLVRISDNDYHLFSNDDNEISNIKSSIDFLEEKNQLNLSDLLWIPISQNKKTRQDILVFGKGRENDYKEMFNSLVKILTETPITTFEEETKSVVEKINEIKQIVDEDEPNLISFIGNQIHIDEGANQEQVDKIKEKLDNLKKEIDSIGMNEWKWLNSTNNKLRKEYNDFASTVIRDLRTESTEPKVVQQAPSPVTTPRTIRPITPASDKKFEGYIGGVLQRYNSFEEYKDALIASISGSSTAAPAPAPPAAAAAAAPKEQLQELEEANLVAILSNSDRKGLIDILSKYENENLKKYFIKYKLGKTPPLKRADLIDEIIISVSKKLNKGIRVAGPVTMPEEIAPAAAPAPAPAATARLSPEEAIKKIMERYKSK